ncbi:hypothetical protein BJ912DRAFT_429729 [Pholiota molesta]|nr:hypothetical protein BJ912DRAFT_429729 [Pholiota molesta]
MPFNTKTCTTKSVAPFKPSAQSINTAASKGAQRPVTQTTASALKVDTKAPINGDQATTNQSDEENVRPASNEASEPLSPLLSALSGMPKAQERDLRAYEHDRQRTKRAGERALRRARKATFSGGGKRAPSTTGEDKDRDAKRKPRGKFEVEVDAGVDAVSKATWTVPAAALIEGLSNAAPGAGHGAIARANERAMESIGDGKGIQINFEDLLVHSSQRKARKTKEEEFELVPAVKGVIVLDDMPTGGGHDMEIDEPWEHIESEEGDGKKMKAGKRAELSYAAVVVGTAE